MSRKILTSILATSLMVGLVFAVWPELDLAAAGFFYRGGAFLDDAPGARSVRLFLHYLPLAVAGAMAIAYGLAKAGAPLPHALAPKGRSMAFVALTLALGPGLLVNGLLKEHWNRPRPKQVQEFGGTMEFRPWHRMDGACARNCSFVSGETSGAFWLVAPALLAPAPLRPVAVGSALAAGVGAGVGRMAFGGHFLTDVVFSALLTLLIVQLLYGAFLGGDRRQGAVERTRGKARVAREKAQTIVPPRMGGRSGSSPS